MGCPACTVATNELVVPRSIPTARPLQTSLLCDSPGSEMSKRASTGIRVGSLSFFVLTARLFQEATIVACSHHARCNGRVVGGFLGEALGHLGHFVVVQGLNPR